MSSRDSIISAIRGLGLEKKPLPAIPRFTQSGDLVGQFRRSLEANHAVLIECDGEEEAARVLNEMARRHSAVISVVDRFAVSTIDLAVISHPSELQDVQLAIIEGEIGVAENGAIWLPEQNMRVRALPFIVLHLVIVLKRDALVANMHEAYAKMKTLPGFGTFIAGPSKTADIEQALVIGAHGPKSLTVVLI